MFAVWYSDLGSECLHNITRVNSTVKYSPLFPGSPVSASPQHRSPSSRGLLWRRLWAWSASGQGRSASRHQHRAPWCPCWCVSKSHIWCQKVIYFTEKIIGMHLVHMEWIAVFLQFAQFCKTGWITNVNSTLWALTKYHLWTSPDNLGTLSQGLHDPG